jgi:hypothetical protein
MNQDLQIIPGVGSSIARDLASLGFRRVSDLAGRNPEAMYEAINQMRGQRQDRCLLYVFRCAVYFAGRRRHDPEKLKWWSWSDERLGRGRRIAPQRSAARAGSSARMRRAASGSSARRRKSANSKPGPTVHPTSV